MPFDFKNKLKHKIYNFNIEPNNILLIDLINKTLTFKHKGSIMKASFEDLEELLEPIKTE